jgi:hypothetical protein
MRHQGAGGQAGRGRVAIHNGTVLSQPFFFRGAKDFTSRTTTRVGSCSVGIGIGIGVGSGVGTIRGAITRIRSLLLVRILTFPVKVFLDAFEASDVIGEQTALVALNRCRLQQYTGTHRKGWFGRRGRTIAAAASASSSGRLRLRLRLRATTTSTARQHITAVGLDLILQGLHVQFQVLEAVAHRLVIIRGQRRFRGGTVGIASSSATGRALEFVQEIAPVLTVIHTELYIPSYIRMK